MAQEWQDVCASQDILPGEMQVHWVGDTPVCLINYEGDLYALEDRCSHEDFELSQGEFDPLAGTVECVLHGAKFDVTNGHPLCAPAYRSVLRFAVKRENGRVWVGKTPL
ncbi:non-heme iron oxygenase ferredoxin subunit [Pseudomarimonas arenosa]|uniref:Non-heme iron oxygenase ferredoxin subunit n=1 Tax=Pseudomarimonas arenosa TaxID=2774145 RepID=A0AAW3ZL93_9GAMM|nr:non-heme iron oxygenase ferredoxin subunit [Pseudomarimonas arenosa]